MPSLASAAIVFCELCGLREQFDIRSTLDTEDFGAANLNCIGKDGAPEEIRTPDPQIRSLVLYPAELRARAKKAASGAAERFLIAWRRKSKLQSENFAGNG